MKQFQNLLFPNYCPFGSSIIFFQQFTNRSSKISKCLLIYHFYVKMFVYGYETIFDSRTHIFIIRSS